MALTAERPLRVLMVHSAYQQRGGEDSVVDAEIDLLRGAGHEVVLYRRDNAEVERMGRLQLAAETVWSRRTGAEIDAEIARFAPDVIHVHNTMPLVSPSVYWAAARRRVPVVQTLHNFRLMCPQGMLLREQAVCEDCVGRLPWRAVVHRCYRGSAAGSAVLASTVSLHRLIGTYRDKVTLYIALNRFCRDKFVEGGLPADSIRIKPNFLDMAAPEAAPVRDGGLFVGRLSVEKGVHVLAQALAADASLRVGVVGTGELDEATRAAFGARLLGFKPLPEILGLMQRAAYLVLPSIWYENFPRTIVEAYACGLPVIASRLGALPEIVEDGETGLLFDPGSAEDLQRKLAWAQQHPDEMARMGERARRLYEALYTPAVNHQTLVGIYEEAIRKVQHAH